MVYCNSAPSTFSTRSLWYGWTAWHLDSGKYLLQTPEGGMVYAPAARGHRRMPAVFDTIPDIRKFLVTVLQDEGLDITEGDLK